MPEDGFFRLRKSLYAMFGSIDSESYEFKFTGGTKLPIVPNVHETLPSTALLVHANL